MNSRTETPYAYNPLKFFGIAFASTWGACFAAAYLSQTGGTETEIGSFMGLGLLGPLTAALICVATSGSQALKRDFRSKLTNFALIKPRYLPAIFLFMPALIILSILISLLFGESTDQLSLTAHFNIMEGSPILSLLIPFLAPALEELGWSGYGIDSLRSRHYMLKSTVLFAILWALWHLPLFFVKGYYHYNLLQANSLYAVNFFVSVIPMTIVTNWLYFKNNRSIIAAMVFHAVVVVSSEAFPATNFTKCIVTLVISVFSIALIASDKPFFFDGANFEKRQAR